MNNKFDIYLDKIQQPDFKNYFLINEEDSIEIFPNFNKINIFLGANNSGKSKFIRELMKQSKIGGMSLFSEFQKNIDWFNEIAKKLNVKWWRNEKIKFASGIPPAIEKNSKLQIDHIPSAPAKIFEIIGDNEKDIFNNNLKVLFGIIDVGFNYINNYYTNDEFNNDQILSRQDYTEKTFLRKINLLIKIVEKIIELKKKQIDFRQGDYYFIPTLRTAHSLFEKEGAYRKIKRDIFLDTISKNYQLDDYFLANPKILINPFTGVHLYYQIINARNGLKSKRKKFEDFEKFIGKEFFNVPSVDIVAKFNINEKHENNDQNEIINIHIGEESRNLYELGDGVQALIILMYSFLWQMKTH